VNLFEMEEGLKLKLGNLGKLTTLIPLLRKRGLVHGAVTHGSQGSVLWNEREVWEVKFQVKSQKLVVGAGDGFLAGYLKASHDKRPLVERARWACAAGAAVAAHGITGFQLTTVQRFLNRVQVRKIS
jgi:fructose-1-phosphate kinase PfkB-like protein